MSQCALQLYKEDRSVWATGTDRAKDKPAILAVQARTQSANYLGCHGHFIRSPLLASS